MGSSRPGHAGGVAGALTFPALALAHGWRVALTVCQTLVAGATVLVWLQPDGGAHRAAASRIVRASPRAPLATGRSSCCSGALALSVAQSSVLACALRARCARHERRGGGGSWRSRRPEGPAADSAGDRERPALGPAPAGVIINAGIGGTIYLVLASGLSFIGPAAAVLAVVAGIGTLAFG